MDNYSNYINNIIWIGIMYLSKQKQEKIKIFLRCYYIFVKTLVVKIFNI